MFKYLIGLFKYLKYLNRRFSMSLKCFHLNTSNFLSMFFFIQVPCNFKLISFKCEYEQESSVNLNQFVISNYFVCRWKTIELSTSILKILLHGWSLLSQWTLLYITSILWIECTFSNTKQHCLLWMGVYKTLKFL